MGSTEHPRSFITCSQSTYCARHPIPVYLGLMGWRDNNHQHLLSTYYTLALGKALRARNVFQSIHFPVSRMRQHTQEGNFRLEI